MPEVENLEEKIFDDFICEKNRYDEKTLLLGKGDNNNTTYKSNSDCTVSDNTNIQLPKSIHFGAVAWGCGFYVGVHKAMEERWGIDFHTKLISIHGDSAGVFFALGIALGKSSEYMNNLYRTLSLRAFKEGIHKNSDIINDALDDMLSDKSAYLQVNNRLSIGVTEFPLHHVRYTQWSSNHELRECLHGSMYLPLYCELIQPVQGKYVIDGGFSFSGESLHHGNESLFIGIDPNAEISGELSLIEMAYPMVNESYDKVVDMGFNSLISWKGEMKDKITNRRKNWVGLIMWPMMLISLLIYYIKVIFCLRCRKNKETSVSSTVNGALLES